MKSVEKSDKQTEKELQIQMFKLCLSEATKQFGAFQFVKILNQESSLSRFIIWNNESLSSRESPPCLTEKDSNLSFFELEHQRTSDQTDQPQRTVQTLTLTISDNSEMNSQQPVGNSNFK